MGEDKQPKTRSLNDALGLGEAASSFFNFFGKIVELLPFEKVTGAQVQFFVVFLVLNLAIFILALAKIISIIALYFLLGIDTALMIWSFIIANRKGK